MCECRICPHIGLTELSTDKLERAVKVRPIHTVEMSYGLSNRSIENNGILDTARNNGIEVLAFAVLSHGLLSENAFVAAFGKGMPDEMKNNLLAGICEIAANKRTTVEKLPQAYVWCKNPDMSILIGTTRREHLKDSIDALKIELTEEDIENMEKAFSVEMLQGMGMRNFTFRDGKFEGRA